MTNTNKQTYTFRHQHDVTGEIIELKAQGTNRGKA